MLCLRNLNFADTSKPVAKSLYFLLKSIAYGLALAFLLMFFFPSLNHFTTPLFSRQDTAEEQHAVSYARAVRRAAPAVVNVYTRSTLVDPRSLRPRTIERQELGSGVIMSAQGYILTNYHVVYGADHIEIALQDGRWLEAVLIGQDELTDLAVLYVQADNLPVIPQDAELDSQVGDVVLAIGNPLNLGQTITQGIISATGRNGLSSGYLDFLQTDAAINAGNSGGALIDTNGSLIGINTAAFQVGGEGGGHGINFAIPIKLAHSIMGKLIKNGRVIRGALGISGEPINPVVAQILNLPDLRGVLVTGVDPNGPAARAQLQPRDVIIKYGDEDVPGVEMLMDRIAETTPGKKIMMTVIRQGKQQELPVIIDEKVVVDN